MELQCPKTRPQTLAEQFQPKIVAKCRQVSARVASDLRHVVGLVHLGAVEGHLPLDNPRPLLVPAAGCAAPGALTSSTQKISDRMWRMWRPTNVKCTWRPKAAACLQRICARNASVILVEDLRDRIPTSVHRKVKSLKLHDPNSLREQGPS